MKRWLLLPLFAGAFLAGESAWAQSTRLGEGNWRQSSRSRVSPREASMGDFVVELRFGPYWPEVDEEFALAEGEEGPYERIFNANAQFYLGLEVDWVPLQIPHVGKIGAGFGWGYTSTSTPADKLNCDPGPSPCESGEDTSLTIMPMHLSAVLRVDELMRAWRIPIVPYGKIGIGLGTWSSSEGGDTAEYNPDTEAPPEAYRRVARDTTMGIHMALGGMLSLNFLQPRSSASLYDTTGMRHAFLFGEWMNTQLDGFGGPKMHIGTSTWVLGLAGDL